MYIQYRPLARAEQIWSCRITIVSVRAVGGLGRLGASSTGNRYQYLNLYLPRASLYRTCSGCGDEMANGRRAWSMRLGPKSTHALSLSTVTGWSPCRLGITYLYVSSGASIVVIFSFLFLVSFSALWPRTWPSLLLLVSSTCYFSQISEYRCRWALHMYESLSAARPLSARVPSRNIVCPQPSILPDPRSQVL